MSTSFCGIYPAFLTPLDADRKFAPKVAESLLLYLLSTGVDGTYVAGSTGEGTRLPISERKTLVETLIPLMSGKKLIVHVGAATIGDALSLANHAAKHGAAAISSLPPVGDASDVRAFYEKLASESPLPLILYYFPKIAPAAFADPQELIDICDLPNVLGVKFTDFNFYLLQRLVKKGNLLLNGYDEALAAGLLMGAQGGIGSTYNIMPQVYLKIFHAAKQGDWEAARTWQSHANSVLDILLKYPFFPALRGAMAHRGFDCGPLMSGETFTSNAQRDTFLEDMDRNIPVEIAELIQWRPATFA